jgi:hypothetical protein
MNNGSLNIIACFEKQLSCVRFLIMDAKRVAMRSASHRIETTTSDHGIEDPPLERGNTIHRPGNMAVPIGSDVNRDPPPPPPRDPNPNSVEAKAVRELIKHENILLDQRRSHFAVLQGLMWTAAALLVKKESDKQPNADLIFIVSLAGALHALVSMFSLRYAVRAIDRLINDNNMPRGDLVVGLHAMFPDENKKPPIFERFLRRSNYCSVTPGIMCATWISFAVYILKKPKIWSSLVENCASKTSTRTSVKLSTGIAQLAIFSKRQSE